MNEAGGSAILFVRIRGGGNQCNKTEWALNYTVRDVSAQCEQYHAMGKLIIIIIIII